MGVKLGLAPQYRLCSRTKCCWEYVCARERK